MLSALSIKSKSFSDGNDCSRSFSRKSCDFTSHAFTCINKANVNLSKVKESLEEWQKMLSVYHKTLRDQLEEKILKYNETELSTPKYNLEPIKSGAALEVFGTEITNPTGKCKSISLVNNEKLTDIAITQKHVVQNVSNLLQRIEEDRSNTEKLLYIEQCRTKSLQQKIDTHAYKRIHELPDAIQKEHERCAYNVQELKWHCAYQGRVEARILEKVRVAETANNKITEEINFVKENSPLIEDKLNLEKEAMAIIQKKQDDTDKELKDTKQKLAKTEREFEQKKRQADHEQRMLAEKILSLSNELNSSLGKLLTLQEEHEEMNENISDMQTKITVAEEEGEHLKKKLIKFEEIETFLEEQLEQLNDKISEETLKHETICKNNEKLTKEKSGQVTAFQSVTTNLENELKKETMELQQLLKSSRSTENEIKHIRRKIENCEKQKIADSKAVKRSLIERDKVHKDLQVIKEETDQTRLIHEKLLLRLDQARGKAAEIEENLITQSEMLKKQSKDENHARVILQARINADMTAFNFKKEESEKKRGKLLKTDHEIQSILATVNAQVKKLDSKCMERLKAIEAINKLLLQIEHKRNEQEKILASQLNDLLPKEEKLKVVLSDISQRQQDKEDMSDGCNKKLCDMASSSVMMNKLLLSNERAIDELNEELIELNLQLDSEKDLSSKLKKSLQQVQERAMHHGKQHELQAEQRTASWEELKQNLEISLQENKELAIQYINLQNEHISKKNSFINRYEKAVIAQDALQDKQTLCELHTRLHKALKCYYELRGIQTRAGLSRFEEMTRRSNIKLERVQRELETSTRNISAFLTASNNAHNHLHTKRAYHQTSKISS